MGWFDDNHPMGSSAEAMMHEALEAMGSNKWYKDPGGPGTSGPTRVEYPESEWDSTTWRKSNFREYDMIAKGKAKTQFLLTDIDMISLQYRKEMNNAGYNNMKMYRKADVERVAWTKCGGPNGLKAAKAAKKNGGKSSMTSSKQAASSSSRGKTKSSSSKSVGGKQAVLGG